MSNLIEKLSATMDSDEQDCLIKAWNLLKSISDDLYAEDMEDTDEYFYATEAYKFLGRFLEESEIDYEEVEIGTTMNCGVTECCGYDFGIDAFGKKKLKFCPMCGKKITEVN